MTSAKIIADKVVLKLDSQVYSFNGAFSKTNNVTEDVLSYLNRTITTFRGDTVTTLVSYAFQYYYSLNNVVLPICSHIGQAAFFDCSNLATLTLLSTSVCQLDYNWNSYANKLKSIYVPSTLLSEYKTAYGSISSYFLSYMEE